MDISISNKTNQLTILKGLSIIFLIGLVNDFYKGPLFEISPLAFWFQDVMAYIFIPLIILYYLYSRFNFSPTEYGLIKPSRIYPLSEIVGSTFLLH